MYIPENDAAIYECPFSMNLESKYYGCRGQKCMAWRWEPTIGTAQDGYCGLVIHNGPQQDQHRTAH